MYHTDLASADVEALTKEGIYAGACKMAESNNASQVMAAKEEFSKIQDYKDSNERLTVCDEKLAELAEKKKVGNRLAYLALANDYGVDAIDTKPAIYDRLEKVDGKLYVYFNVTGGGLSPIHIELPGFEVAGEDRVFYPATGFVAESNTSCIEIRCPEVVEPVAVRYGMKNWSVATLFNCYGTPVSPFRSDDWEK